MAVEHLATAIPERVEDQILRRKAASFIGAVATGEWNQEAIDNDSEDVLKLKPIESLLDGIRLAYEGDERGRKMVETNVFTDAIERTIKSGHIMEICLSADEAGNIQQHGQLMDSVQANSLRFAANNAPMRARVEAETRNAFRVKHYFEQGMLEDYRFVTISRAADDMSVAEMKKAGFFTDTMSAAIQVTSADGDQLMTESAFVAGTKMPGMERHDRQTIEGMIRSLGVELYGMTATELLDTPLLVHKSLMPNGVVDLVEQYDLHAGGTFFGEAKPQQNYATYRMKCLEREKTFKPKVDQIVTELIAEAPAITSRVMATERLHKLCGRHMIDLAATDWTINADVFGRESAARIEMARQHYERGNAELALAEIREAVKTDQSSSCPSGAASGSDGESREGNNKSGDDGDCEFTSKECPLCHKKNVHTTVKKIAGTRKQISGACGCSITVKAG